MVTVLAHRIEFCAFFRDQLALVPVLCIVVLLVYFRVRGLLVELPVLLARLFRDGARQSFVRFRVELRDVVYRVRVVGVRVVLDLKRRLVPFSVLRRGPRVILSDHLLERVVARPIHFRADDAYLTPFQRSRIDVRPRRVDQFGFWFRCDRPHRPRCDIGRGTRGAYRPWWRRAYRPRGGHRPVRGHRARRVSRAVRAGRPRRARWTRWTRWTRGLLFVGTRLFTHNKPYDEADQTSNNEYEPDREYPIVFSEPIVLVPRVCVCFCFCFCPCHFVYFLFYFITLFYFFCFALRSFFFCCLLRPFFL